MLPSDDDPCEDDASLFSGSAFDDLLLHSEVLTVEEVMQRRAQRLRHLLKMYRAQYWALLEEMRSKYRRFYLRHGKCGWRRDADAAISRREDEHDANPPSTPGEMKEPNAPEKAGSEILRCSMSGCSAKPLLLSSYCYSHILQEPRQRLYKPCTYVVRRGNGTQNVVCQKPVLQAVSSLLCPTHFQQTQKKAQNSLKKAGILLSPGLFPKSTPKLHYFVAEYVRVIQARRRAFRIAESRGETSASANREGQGFPSVTGSSKQGTSSRSNNRKDTD